MKSVIALAAFAAVVAAPAAALAEDWHPFSRSSAMIYLADVDSIAESDGVTVIRVAKVPKVGTRDDPGYRVDEIAFRCADNEAQTRLTIEYGPTGEEQTRYDDPEAPWDPTGGDTYLSFLQGMTCGGNRAAGRTWSTIPDFIAAGRDG